AHLPPGGDARRLVDWPHGPGALCGGARAVLPRRGDVHRPLAAGALREGGHSPRVGAAGGAGAPDAGGPGARAGSVDRAGHDPLWARRARPHGGAAPADTGAPRAQPLSTASGTSRATFRAMPAVST